MERRVRLRAGFNLNSQDKTGASSERINNLILMISPLTASDVTESILLSQRKETRTCVSVLDITSTDDN